MTQEKANLMWGGRFAGGQDALMEEINASIDFDKRLAEHDIFASKVHAKMLSDQGIISEEDYKSIVGGLDQISLQIKKNEFVFDRALEDIHMNVEARLKEIIGEPAGRLHTARSRNDQVATDFRLWVRDQIDFSQKLIKSLIEALLDQAELGADWVMPGFTHLQMAQPVTWGHHMMAYVEMFSRDLSRFTDARDRMNECPLGSAALAGTSFPINREKTSSALNFKAPSANSLDAVSDRDFALEFLSVSSICAMHLSRLAEELVIWSSAQFKLISLSDRFSTGSSIMPQKKNPDAAELIRAKTGRVNGALLSLLTVMKGLPLAYAKDMQEDKESVFDVFDTLILVIKITQELIEKMKINRTNMYNAASNGFSTATDLADWFVRELGMPFRQAHSLTGKIVEVALRKNIKLSEFSLSDLKKFEPNINEKVFKVLSPESSIESRNSFGGTALREIKRQIRFWKRRLNV